MCPRHDELVRAFANSYDARSAPLCPSINPGEICFWKNDCEVAKKQVKALKEQLLNFEAIVSHRDNVITANACELSTLRKFKEEFDKREGKGSGFWKERCLKAEKELESANMNNIAACGTISALTEESKNRGEEILMQAHKRLKEYSAAKERLKEYSAAKEELDKAKEEIARLREVCCRPMTATVVNAGDPVFVVDADLIAKVDALTELEARRGKEAAINGTSAWKPIETAPKDRSLLLYHHRDGEFVGKWFHDTRGRWVIAGGDGSALSPSYWCPLPEPPR